MSLAHLLQGMFQMTTIVLVSVINHYHINGLHLLWDTLYIYIYIYIYIYKIGNYNDKKIRHTPTYGALNSCDLHHWRSNQQPQLAEAETLPPGYRFMAHINDAELTSDGGRVSASAYCGCWLGLLWWRSRWWDLIGSKQLFSVPYDARRWVPDFLVMVISNLIFQFLHS